ncbi:MAG: zf-HC2 domain-containing protein [Deltaproteobacteria bacterium]|nr:zf-HC2 domain-containing protein [Deltaproteobacteria bacterium]
MSDACREFDSLLLDLAYGELDDGTRTRLEAHAASCAACAAALDAIVLTRKLSAQIETPAPPDAFDAAILEAARLATASHAGAHGQAEPVRVARRPVVQGTSLGERLRALFLRPALVTACVAAVVLGVSVFVMRNTASPSGSSGRRESQSPFLGPALPLGAAPAVESKTAAREEGARIENAPAASATALSPRGKQGGARPASAGPAKAADGFVQAEDKKDLEQDADKRAALGADRARKTEAPREEARGAGAAPALGDLAGNVGAGETSYRDGMAAYARGDCASATEALRRVLGPASGAPDRVPSALHHMGRCEKRQGRCAEALPYYDELLGRYPSYPARAEALVEASACERRLGHLNRAKARLDELSAEPGGAAKAKKAAADPSFAE